MGAATNALITNFSAAQFLEKTGASAPHPLCDHRFLRFPGPEQEQVVTTGGSHFNRATSNPNSVLLGPSGNMSNSLKARIGVVDWLAYTNTCGLVTCVRSWLCCSNRGRVSSINFYNSFEFNVLGYQFLENSQRRQTTFR